MNRDNYGGAGNTFNTASMIGFMQWFQALAGCPFDIVSLSGNGGRNVNTLVNEFDAETLAYNPDIVMIGSDAVGNSIGQNTNSVVNSAESCIASMKILIEKCYAADAVPVVLTLPPNNNNNSTQDANGFINPEWHKYNDQLLALARNDPRLILVLVHEFSIDLAEAGGRAITTTSAGVGAQSTQWTHDGTHPHPKLAIKMGQILQETLRSTRFVIRTLPLINSNSHPYRCVANPVNFGSSGTKTGGTLGVSGNNCILGGAGLTTGSKVARTDFSNNGEWQRIVCAAETVSATYIFSDAGLGLPANMVAGVTPVYAVVEIMLNAAPTNLRGFMWVLSFIGSATTFIGFNTVASGSSAGLADAGPYIPLATKLMLHTPTGMLPAGVTGFTLTLTATKAAAGNLTVDFYVGRAAIVVAPVVPYIDVAINLP